MRVWKRCAALLLAAVLCGCILTGCGSQESQGIALSVCAGDEPESLDPIYATETADQTILMNLYENLMRKTVDASGGTTVTNGIAKSVSQEENYDGTVTYTFRLRNTKWSDGRSVKAEDFVYAWQRLADPASGSPYSTLLSVVAGYQEVQETGDVSLLQVSAESDTTLVVVLGGKYDWFLTEVCTSPATLPLRQDVIQKWRDQVVAAQEQGEDLSSVPEKWWSDIASLVTNGPYQVEEYAAGAYLRTAANSKYYGNGAGPSELTFHFAKTAEEARTLYEEKTVDFVWTLSQERLTELAEEEETRLLTPELGEYLVLLNCNYGAFTDPVVREAMTMVIDRGALAEIAGGTAQAAEGLVPPGVPGEEEDFRTEGGTLLDNNPEHYEELCQQARKLLSDAGYDNGYGIDDLEYLYVDEGTNGQVAEALTEMWEEALQIHVTAVAVTREELDEALETGEYAMAGVWFRALGNDAECFLMPWTTNCRDNVVGYENSAYDTLMSIIASAEDNAARMGCLHDAEALLLDGHVVAPVYTTSTAWELRDPYTGVCRDSRGWFIFSGVVKRSA